MGRESAVYGERECCIWGERVLYMGRESAVYGERECYIWGERVLGEREGRGHSKVIEIQRISTELVNVLYKFDMEQRCFFILIQ